MPKPNNITSTPTPPKSLTTSERLNIKQKIFTLESSNHDKIYLYWNGGGFYRVAERSLLFYYFHVATPLGITANIVSDTDYGDLKFNDGILSFQGLDHLFQRLGKLNLIKSRTVSRDGLIITITLNRTFADDEITEMTTNLAKERRQIGADLVPVVSDPDIFAKLRFLEKRTLELACKTRNNPERDIIGLPLAKLGHSLVADYLKMEQNILPVGECWYKLYNTSRLILIELASASELRIWDAVECAKLAHNVILVRNALEKIILKNRPEIKESQKQVRERRKVEQLKELMNAAIDEIQKKEASHE